MERAAWLKRMREMAEGLYDRFSHYYWVKWGIDVDAIHREHLQKFLARVGQPGLILSAACGAGRFDGLLMAAGHRVVGIDQSAGVLARAREHFPQEQFPQIRYEKIGLQEMDFREEFDGAICMDAMEHICPEDWPVILRGFQAALKPGRPLYLTADARDKDEVEAAYRHALDMGLPVVYGEVADEVEAAFQHALETGDVVDQSVYHFCPALELVRDWLEQAGFSIAEVGSGSEYWHIIAVKS
ncbi:MAG TPA: class I SAM-dependent methyltransferase [Anaerolineaceae bacterium]